MSVTPERCVTRCNRSVPRFVFHLAAQPIVRASYTDPLETITSNVVGTANLLEALRGADWPITAIIITSDKCYDNVEWVWGYRETDRLGGKDIYSCSKAAAELVFKSYWHSFFGKPESTVRLATVRAGNVIGGGDWAADRIVADCVRAWGRNERVQIRSPSATRPWQHVLEPLSGYLTLGAHMARTRRADGDSYNFGPRAEQNHTVVELLADLGRIWGFQRGDEAFEITGDVPFHEAGLLKLNCDKALLELGWEPTLSYEECMSMTGLWYRQVLKDGVPAGELTFQQIAEYERLGARARACMDKSLSAPFLTPLRRIPTPKGDVLHAMKASDPGYAGFGEAYFSAVHEGAIKGWKRHYRMTLNLVCIAGAIQFVVYGDGDAVVVDATLAVATPALYRRLTVPPLFWVGFRGASPGENIVLNLASLPHDPDEAETVALDRFPWPGTVAR